MRLAAQITLIVATLLSGTAAAQTPMRIRGTIQTVATETVAVRTEGGETLAILLPANVRYGSVIDRTLADIRPGDFVGSAAMRGRDGRLHAQEVHIFPESQRGSGEGHRPMDLPEQTMTNAAVDGVAEADANGRVLTLRYPGGEQRIEVAPDVRVVEMVPGDRTLLVPGAAVTIRATRAADGTIQAIAVQAEKNGVKPLP